MTFWKLIACLTGLFVLAPLAAADPPGLKVRVTGLFAPSREKDLREALFPKAKPADVIARLDERVRNLTNHTFGIKAVSAVPKEKLVRVEIAAAGLDCKACCLAAYEIVAKIDGVEQATASFKEGRITARIDPAKTEKAKLEAALKERGVLPK